MEIDFDPEQIAFADIVDLFWKAHNPLGPVHKYQYMSAIWYHDDTQHNIINVAKAEIETRLDAAVSTPILPLKVFHNAEDYHQKYRLQHSPLIERLNAIYPNFEDLNNSTAAARLNGFLAGNGSRELFATEIDSYGFSPEELMQAIRR